MPNISSGLPRNCTIWIRCIDTCCFNSMDLAQVSVINEGLCLSVRLIVYSLLKSEVGLKGRIITYIGE